MDAAADTRGVVVGGGDAPAPGGGGARTLSAAQVAKALGRQKRAVLLWASEDGCPHTLAVSRGRPSPRFNLAEVKAWLVGEGRDVRRTGAEDPGSEARGGEGAGGAEGGTDASLFASVDEWIRLFLSGAMDWEGAIARVRAAFLNVVANPPAAIAEPGEKQKWSQAFANVSKELRALELAHVEALKRKGELIEKARAVAITASLASTLRTDLEGLVADLPREAASRLDGTLAPEQLEGLRRVLAVAGRERVDAVLRRLAEGIRKAVGELERAEGG